MSPHSVSPASFRRRCRVLRWATLFVFACLAGLLLPSLVGLPMVAPGSALHIRGGDRLLMLAIHGLPAAGYLWALWSVQRALGDLAAGRTFHPTVARAMRHIGGGVLAGALFEVFAVGNLARWALGGQGGYLYFDIATIVLGVVGAALVLLAQLVDQARALQAELDEIF